ncbi:putative ATPase [Frondihabitans sp. PhB188]|nr:putative ATPase [Frondihabitans sp. PhB188]
MLGPVRVAGREPGTLVEPAGPRAKAFIVALSVAGASGVTSPRLIDDLWGDTPPRQAKAALQTLVSRVRHAAADDLVVSTPTGYRLGDPKATDLHAVRTLLAQAAGAEPAEADHLATTALATWRGSPAADLDGFELVDDLVAEAAGLRADALRTAATARCSVGDGQGALAALDELDSLLAERGRRTDDGDVALRMRALAADGRRTAALRVFAAHREALADELGSSPSALLIAANTALLTEADDGAEAAGAAAEAVPPSSATPTPRRTRIAVGLRTAPNELLGRAADIAAVEHGLTTSRLVTILGPGGLGKTRLAQEVARRAGDSTARVVVVELAAVRSDDDVVLAVASALGVREVGAPRLRLADPGVRRGVRERLADALLEMPTLLVLDNCEHVIGSAAELTAEMLAETADVRVLATSRSPLSIGAEVVHPLETLPSAGAAVELFEQRARSARPGVALPREAVQRLCARLDGLPLAIELAAARVRSMAVDEIERRLGNRFALLTSGDRSAPERHRTLTAVIDWSWNLLADDERVLLARLSRFPDGFSADAAQIVGSHSSADQHDVADALDGLVRQSLVGVSEEHRTGRVRYRMLETVREFGDAQLIASGESDDVREAMFRWAEWFSSDIRSHLDGPDQVRRFAVMAAEQDDLVHVLRLAVDVERRGTVADAFAVLGYFWSLNGSHADVTAFAPDVVRVLRTGWPAPEHRDAELLACAVAGSQHLFGGGRAGTLALGRLRRLRRDGPAADARLEALTGLFLATLVGVEAFQGHLARMAASSDSVIVELGSVITAQIAENDGRIDDAFVHARRAYDSTVQNGHAWATATSAGFLSQLHAQEAQPREALEWAEKARTGLVSLGAVGDLAEVEWRQASARIALGDVDGARAGFAALLDDAGPTPEGDQDVRVFARCGLAEIAFLEGRHADALRMYDEAVLGIRDDRSRFRSPIIALSEAAALSAHLRARTGGAEHDRHVGRMATRLRTRLIAQSRVPQAFQDVPIAGAAVFALASWILACLPAEFEARGIRLAQLGIAMHGRQDISSLEHARLLDTGRIPDVTAMTSADARREAIALLSDRRLRR